MSLLYLVTVLEKVEAIFSFKKISPLTFHPFQMDLSIIRSLMMSPRNFRNTLDLQLMFSSSSSAPQQTCINEAHLYSVPISLEFHISQRFVCVLKGNEMNRKACILYLYSNSIKKDISPPCEVS